ncbi:MAG TPA: formate/nitrite transporter family protein [Candidatus Dormibacteraeota bacterium]|nr:formate/nitrite transporter family protein [Candidatus Dormibacteraeota bacterium]
MAEERTREQKEIEDRTAPPGHVVYHAIHREGEHELQRSSWGLAWSGLAAGLSLGFSIVTQALLRTHLPEAHWAPLVSRVGYTVGFLMVILGRQQLFTENTLTPILPLLTKKRASVGLNVARLWAIVLVTNIVGGFAYVALIAHSSMFNGDMQAAFAQIGREAMPPGIGSGILLGIFAGWLLALMVWLLPFAESARVWVIVIISYLVGLGGFSHVIVGSMEVFYLVTTSEMSFLAFLGQYFAPTLLGNVLGGVSLVALLAHAQFIAPEDKANE